MSCTEETKTKVNAQDSGSYNSGTLEIRNKLLATQLMKTPKQNDNIRDVLFSRNQICSDDGNSESTC
jgi:hypothetical protein